MSASIKTPAKKAPKRQGGKRKGAGRRPDQFGEPSNEAINTRVPAWIKLAITDAAHLSGVSVAYYIARRCVGQEALDERKAQIVTRKAAHSAAV